MTAVMIEIAFFGIAILAYLYRLERKFDSRLSALEARVSSLEARLSSLEASVSSLAEGLSSLAASLASLEARVSRLEGMFEGYLAGQKSPE